MTLEDVAWEATARHRFRAVMVMTFAGLALLLAMVGVFGILAYSVQQRVRDFGVRRALGATTSDVLRLVVGSAVRVIAAGAVIGLALSAVLGRLLATMLFGVQPLDPMTFALVTIVLALTAARVDCRSRLACDPHRSGGRVARRVMDECRGVRSEIGCGRRSRFRWSSASRRGRSSSSIRSSSSPRGSTSAVMR